MQPLISFPFNFRVSDCNREFWWARCVFLFAFISSPPTILDSPPRLIFLLFSFSLSSFLYILLLMRVSMQERVRVGGGTAAISGEGGGRFGGLRAAPQISITYSPLLWTFYYSLHRISLPPIQFQFCQCIKRKH
ncbi:hypothetical protein ACP275_02G096000 [Erythranthe tilingii]